MRQYVEKTWGRWEPARQKINHDPSFKIDSHQVVLVQGEQVGILATEVHASHIQLEKLYLLPEVRNQGIGGSVLRSLLTQARNLGKPVRLRVLKINSSAQRFYTRHGFSVSSITEERCFMESGA